ncbi:hypothetical protein TrLO_g1635 [Triparma laevis f. longispina]|uniref:Uncharacterized protein n=1 Tax=Triparma laevis f. longispina TaxID=1714387 RepID=A0A9W7E713_9STRA|nr:hypothetical protein TrLO_g1635 [Triparma laevis f. longispina]
MSSPTSSTSSRRSSSTSTTNARSFTTTLYPFLISLTSLITSLSPLPPSPSSPSPLLTLHVPDTTLNLKTGATTVNQWLDNYSTQVFLDPSSSLVLTVKHRLHSAAGDDRITGIWQVEYKNFLEGEEHLGTGDSWKSSMNVLLRIILCYLGSTTSRLASDRCCLWRSLERGEVKRNLQSNLKTLEGWIEVELGFEEKMEEIEGYECRAFRWCNGPTGRVQVKHWDMDAKFLEEMKGEKGGQKMMDVNIVEDYVLKEQEKGLREREMHGKIETEKKIMLMQQQQQQQQHFHPLHTQPPPQAYPRSRRHTVDGNPTFNPSTLMSTSPGQSFLRPEQNPLSEMSGLAQALMNDQQVNSSGSGVSLNQQQMQMERKPRYSFDAGQAPPDLQRGTSRSFDAHYAYPPQNYSLSQSPSTLQMLSHMSRTPPSNPITMPPVKMSPNDRNLSNESNSPLPPLHPGSAPRSAGRSDIYNSSGLTSLGFGGALSSHPSPESTSSTPKKESPLLSPNELTTLPPSPFTVTDSSTASLNKNSLSNLGFSGTQFHVEKTYEVDGVSVMDEGLGGTLEYKGEEDDRGGLDEFREFAKGLKK